MKESLGCYHRINKIMHERAVCTGMMERLLRSPFKFSLPNGGTTLLSLSNRRLHRQLSDPLKFSAGDAAMKLF